jgi:hypothetical protein
MELHVRRRRLRQRAREQAALVDADGERAGARKQPLRPYKDFSMKKPQVVVGGDRLRALVHDAQLQVVLQVFADARQIFTTGCRSAAVRA